MKVAFNCNQVTLTFDGKPSAAVRSILKLNSFRWSPGGGYWWRSSAKDVAGVIAAIDDQERRERGEPKPPVGPCWACKDPAGYFRGYGAATPVYCDACHAKHLQAEADRQAEAVALAAYVSAGLGEDQY